MTISPPSNAGSSGNNKNALSVEQLVQGVLAGDRTTLARAITLVESNSPAHMDEAQEILEQILPHAGNSLRIGITGMPGAGKSTLIEQLGCRLTEQSHKVAVLAVDPSSSITRGSILGDKTRMQRLANDPDAFIRPSPSGGALGGVARKTRESILLFEAAGYDVVLVETIGVGQNEITVRSMVDMFMLLLIPGAGDGLQGIKRGVMEMADAVLINKADGELVAAADRAKQDFEQALSLMQPVTEGWRSRVVTISALNGSGIPELWEMAEEFRALTDNSGVFDQRRKNQAKDWLHSMIGEQLEIMFRDHPEIRQQLSDIEKRVLSGDLPATKAAQELLHVFRAQ